jgi:hypothetical protein
VYFHLGNLADAAAQHPQVVGPTTIPDAQQALLKIANPPPSHLLGEFCMPLGTKVSGVTFEGAAILICRWFPQCPEAMHQISALRNLLRGKPTPQPNLIPPMTSTVLTKLTCTQFTKVMGNKAILTQFVLDHQRPSAEEVPRLSFAERLQSAQASVCHPPQVHDDEFVMLALSHAWGGTQASLALAARKGLARMRPQTLAQVIFLMQTFMHICMMLFNRLLASNDIIMMMRTVQTMS